MNQQNRYSYLSYFLKVRVTRKTIRTDTLLDNAFRTHIHSKMKLVTILILISLKHRHLTTLALRRTNEKQLTVNEHTHTVLF